jgi:hypothetical protein
MYQTKCQWYHLKADKLRPDSPFKLYTILYQQKRKQEAWNAVMDLQ